MERKLRKVREGKVVSAKMNKTVAVLVSRRVQHPLYGKILEREQKFLAHDEENRCREGDVVRMMETKPLSRRKHWRVVEVLNSGSKTV